MPRICCITNKKSIFGKKRSYSMNSTNRKFLPNLHNHRFWVSSKNIFIKIRVSAKGIRIIDKKGIEFYLKKIYKK